MRAIRLAVLPLLCQGTTIDASSVMRRDPEHLHDSAAKPLSFPLETAEVEVQASGKVQEKHFKHQKAKAAMEKEPPALLEGIFDASLAQVQTEETLGLREVMFGIYCRRVFDVDVLQKTWTGDLVITLSWNDPAATQAIPEGQDETRLATEEARKIIWLPDIGVTNRDFKNLEVISSSVKVWKDGRATKVERLLATMTSDFDTKAFPFDQQKLKVILASEKLMADELVLNPHTDQKVTGVKDDVLLGSGFTGLEGAKPNYTIDNFEESDGPLVKSRGVLEIKIHRNSAVAGRQMTPAFIILGVAYSVFFFPMVAAFVMPRVAASIISLLGMLTFMTKNKMPDSWTDVFLEAMCLQVACICLLSLTMEISFHTFKNEEFAKQLSFQYRCSFPVISMVIYVILISCTSGELNDLCTYLIRSLVAVLMVLNFARIYRKLNPRPAADAAPAASAEVPPEGESK